MQEKKELELKDFKPVGKGGGQELGVDKYGVADDVLSMMKDGIAISRMSKILEAKGVKLSIKSITKWISNQKNFKRNKNVKDIKIHKKFETITLDYQEEITNILDEVKEIKDIAKEQGKLDTYAKLVDRLYKGLELLAKLMGDIKPNGSVDINVIINEINKNSFDDNKGVRNNLYDKEVFDIEAEITESDKVEEEKLNGVK